MSMAFDSSVILKALRARAGLQVAGDDLTENERCAAVIEAAGVPIVCPLAWLEVRRWARPAEEAHIAELESRVRLEPVDDDVIRRAIALMKLRVQVWEKSAPCVKCGNPAAGAPCAGCNRLLAEKTRFNDYVIVAHAEANQVEQLFSTDIAMLAMNACVTIDVTRPPGVYGPLFGEADPAERKKKAPRKTPRKP